MSIIPDREYLARLDRAATMLADSMAREMHLRFQIREWSRAFEDGNFGPAIDFVRQSLQDAAQTITITVVSQAGIEIIGKLGADGKWTMVDDQHWAGTLDQLLWYIHDHTRQLICDIERAQDALAKEPVQDGDTS